MKEVTVPITERQIGWILFCSFMSLMDAFFASTYYLIKSGHIVIIGIIIFCNSVFILFAFTMDGRHDTNPAHWIGYCLKLKESKT